MSRTLGQILSDPTTTDDQARDAVKAATTKERAEQLTFYARVLKRDNVYPGWKAQAKRNVEILEEI